MLNVIKVTIFIVWVINANWVFAIDKKTIHLLSINNYQPYSYLEKNQVSGIYVDIINELFDRAGYSVNIQLVPFKRLISWTKSGKTDGAIGIFYANERHEYAKYITATPLSSVSNKLYVLKESAIKRFSFSAIKGKRLGKQRGFLTTPEFDQHSRNGHFEVREAEAVSKLIELLLKKRVDAFTFDSIIAKHYINQMGVKYKIAELSPSIGDTIPTYLAFSRISINKLPNDFFKKISNELANMQEDGSLERIKSAYISEIPKI